MMMLATCSEYFGEIRVKQQKSELFEEFSERTERIASEMTLKLSDLPEKIGISPAMFYAYRKGKYAISDKAWRKLEALEQEIGVRPPGVRPPISEEAHPRVDDPKDIAEFLRTEARKMQDKAMRFLRAADIIDPPSK
jgi:transcriptional regulator with XRE-family HTH domain